MPEVEQTLPKFHTVQWINAVGLIFRGYHEDVPEAIAKVIKPESGEPRGREDPQRQTRSK